MIKVYVWELSKDVSFTSRKRLNPVLNVTFMLSVQNNTYGYGKGRGHTYHMVSPFFIGVIENPKGILHSEENTVILEPDIYV